MPYTSYYLFRPKAELLQKIAGRDLEEILELSEPTLWKNDVNGVMAGGREDAGALKLLFLGNLIKIILSTSDVEALELTECSIRQFDRYWELESYGGHDESLQNVVKSLSDIGFDRGLQSTDNRQLGRIFERFRES